MTESTFSAVFLALVFLTTMTRLWLSFRHSRHVAAHRAKVPDAFADSITLEQHQKAADYTQAKCRLTSADLVVDAGILLALTLGGALDRVAQVLSAALGEGILFGLALFAVVGLISSVINLPLSLYRTFVLEARFGFNRLTWRLWLLDSFKGTLLAAALGAPLLAVALWMMQALGGRWWLYVWMVWLGFNLLMLAIYPSFIAPLFNKFTPLQDASLNARIEALLKRCGFASSGLFVMDGSRRSAHGNAYFTGLGKTKRIVFFDTLLTHLQPAEVEAVLAHELGHFHYRHVIKRIVVMAVASLVLLRLLAWLMTQDWFFMGLGIHQTGTAMALLLFSMVLPVFLFPVTPIMSALSRRDEFQADDYAVRNSSADELVRALVKLYRDNAATLTPDPLHSLFHDSHPPASVRIGHIVALSRTPNSQHA